MQNKRLLLTGIVLVCCLLPVLTVLAGEARSGTAGEGIAVLAEAPAGWTAAEPPRVARGHELFTVINGGAELYVRLGFERAVFASYRSDKGKTINIEIYKMKTAAAARKAYTRKIGNGGETAPFGETALFEGYYLNFYQGAFQVTVSGYDADSRTVDGIYTIAGKVSERLGKP